MPGTQRESAAPGWFKTLKCWSWEICSSIVGAMSTISVFLILYYCNAKPKPQLPLNTTLSPYLSILATITNIAISIPLSSGIGQIMWAKLQPDRASHSEHRPAPPLLKDITLFDSASRSIPGGLKFLYRRRPLSKKAFLGIFTWITTLAIGPCIQATLSTKELSALSSVQRCQEGTLTSVNISSIYKKFHATLVLDDYNHTIKDDQLLQELNTDCRTGDCDWPAPVSTLAFCNSCTTNIKNNISKSCTTDNSQPAVTKCTYTLPNGLAFYNSTNTTENTWFNGTGSHTSDDTTINYSNWDDSHIASISMLMSPNEGLDPEAIECVFYWCIQGYNTSVRNGVLSQNATGSWHGGTIPDSNSSLFRRDINRRLSNPTSIQAQQQSSSLLLETQIISQLPPPPPAPNSIINPYIVMSPPEDQWASLGIANATNFTVDSYIAASMSSLVVNIFNGSMTYQQGNTSGNFMLFILPFTDLTTLPQLFNYTASETTDALRASCPLNVSAIGQANNATLVTHVRWEWLILPGSVILLTILFLVLVIVNSYMGGIPVRKNNPLVLLFYGLAEGNQSNLAKAKSVSDVEVKEKTIRVIDSNEWKEFSESGKVVVVECE